MLISRSWLIIFTLAATSYADPAAKAPIAVGVFTAKTILGIKPSKDQIRIGESDNWRTAFAKCPESNHQPPLRVGDPRMTTTKEKQGAAVVDVVTMETDFECGSCGGKTCPSDQFCVEITSGTSVQKSCELKAPTRPAMTCSAPIDKHIQCTAPAPQAPH